MQRSRSISIGRRRRHRRVRATVRGTTVRPRLSVFRSSKHIVAQIIDDATGRTVAAATDHDVGTIAGDVQRKIALGQAVGKLLAERARERGITMVVFDRGGYAYHGRVRAVAEGAREGGLEF